MCCCQCFWLPLRSQNLMARPNCWRDLLLESYIEHGEIEVVLARKILFMLPKEKSKHKFTQAWSLWSKITTGLVGRAYWCNSVMNIMGVTNQFSFIWLKVCSKRWNPYLAPLLGQRPMAREIINHKKEPTSIILINRHSIKPIPMTYYYTYRLKNFSVLIREASVCSRWWSVWGPTAFKMQRVDCRMSSPKCNTYTTPPPPKAWGSL